MNILNNKVLVIVTEGETDEVFYKKILEVLKLKTPNNYFLVDKIDHICIKGFGKFDSKLNNILKDRVKKYKKRYEYTQIDVFLCYDNDVFIGKKNPPINWDKIEKCLYSNGANHVYHIVADKAIEDFILMDFNGVLRYLNIKNTKNNDYKGHEGLKKLFKKTGKAYIKGSRCDGLLSSLDFGIIEKSICNQLNPLCKSLGVTCNKQKNK